MVPTERVSDVYKDGSEVKAIGKSRGKRQSPKVKDKSLFLGGVLVLTRALFSSLNLKCFR